MMKDGAPARRDFTLVSGDDLDREIAFANADGSAADLSGYAATVFAYGDKTRAPVTISAAISGAVVRLTAAAAVTAGWPGRVLYEIRLQDGAGKLSTPVSGAIDVPRRITIQEV